MARNEKHAASALQRALYADKFYPRLREAINRTLETHVRAAAALAGKGGPLNLSKELLARWAEDLIAAQRRQLIVMIAHGWQLAGKDVPHRRTLAPQGKTFAGYEGKTIVGGVEVGSVPREFLNKADFSRIDKWIRTTSASASSTTAKRMRNIFLRAEKFDEEKQQGVTPKDIAKQMLAEGLVQNEARAEMLAHTGAIWSYNEGAIQRYEAAGVAVVEWLTADDDLRCPFCAEMNGKRIATGEPFFSSGDKLSIDDETMKIPEGVKGFDVMHPPLHPNCRCTLLPVFEESLE